MRWGPKHHRFRALDAGRRQHALPPLQIGRLTRRVARRMASPGTTAAHPVTGLDFELDCRSVESDRFA